MSFFSLKWKLSLSFVLLSLGFVGMYVVVAKKTFESDKISYIFETQQKEVSSISKSFSFQLERVVFDARSILSSYDPQSKKLSSSTQQIFWDHPHIVAIEVSDGAESVAKLEKAQGTLQAAAGKGDDQHPLVFLGDDRYLLVMNIHNVKMGDLKLRLIFNYKDLFDENLDGQTVALVANGSVLKRSSEGGVPSPAIQNFLTTLKGDATEATQISEINGQRYLVSIAKIALGDLKIVSLVDESTAMGALHVLFQRSVVFLFFSFFATVLIALVLSKSLTGNINSLTITAQRIGAGDFSSEPDFKSNDEIGVLAKAFRKMTSEIQRLLLDTADKTRMEAELKTARLVQDSLFPTKAFYKNGQVRLYGTNKTTTECGGDWWFYYQKGSDLFIMVADATGHGIPAALITSAARSVFSVLTDTSATLKEIADSWDKATNECSNGKVFMTAFLLKINVEIGECHFINAGHEPPVLLTKTDKGMKAAYIPCEKNPALGERKGGWIEERLDLTPQDRLLIYTDGLLAITSPDGKGYSERRFLKYLEQTVTTELSPDVVITNIDKHFTELGAGHPMPDDVTIVAVDYRA